MCVVGKECVVKTFVDVLDRSIGGVRHVVGIETIVAEVVEQEFVGGKVADLGCGQNGWIVEDLLARQLEGCLGERVVVRSVAEVANGRNGEDDTKRRVEVMQVTERVGEGSDTFGDRKTSPSELGGGKFMAVVDNGVVVEIHE